MELQTFPKKYHSNMAWRRNLLAKCATDLSFRKKVKEYFFRDPLFAFNAFFYTYDVRKRPLHQQPYCTYPHQDEHILGLIEAINKGYDFLTEKSRDMGVTWDVIGVFVWFWLNPIGGTDFLCGSRTADYVDKKGDMRALLEKVRYLIYRLPTWLRPKGFQRNLHDNFMRLQNPETGASITGESNNPNFSTGGRYAGVLFDEFAKWELSDTSAWIAAGDATPSRIPVSTPWGAAGEYYLLAFNGKVKKIRLHWSLHPEKSKGLYCIWPPPNLRDKVESVHWEAEEKLRSPWYDRECERRSPEAIRQELDIDYLGSGYPVFSGKSAEALKYYRALEVEPQTWFDPSSGEEVPEPRDSQDYLVVYQRAKKEHTYVVCADVAEGKIDGDFSTIKVLNRETGDVDATYYGKVDENELAFVIQFIAGLYTDEEGRQWPWVAPETNACGLATFNKCVELGVRNLFMMPKYEVSKNQVTYRKGWVTGPASRKMIISGIKEYLIERRGFINPRCVGELGTFVKNKAGKPVAKVGCHDDEIMCLGICIQVDQIAPYSGKTPRHKVVNYETIGAQGIREAAFSKEHQKLPEGVEPQTLEEECLAQAVVKQAEKQRPKEEEFEASIDAMFGFSEEDDYF